MFLLKCFGENMSVETAVVEDSCFPGIQDINDARKYCFNLNYDHPDIANANIPIPNALAAYGAHKVLSLISVPANIIGISFAAFGALGSCFLAAIKISVFILSGQRWNMPTNFQYYKNAGKASFYQLFKIVGENLFEYYYRTMSAFDEVIAPRNQESIVTEWKTLPLVEELNRTRNSLVEGERTVKKWFLHKLISIINIPANVASSMISAFGICFGAALVTSKVAIYIFLGLRIQIPTGFEYFFKSFLISNTEILKNAGEIGSDAVLVGAKVASLIGMKDTFERAQDFIANLFRRFSEALH